MGLFDFWKKKQDPTPQPLTEKEKDKIVQEIIDRKSNMDNFLYAYIHGRNDRRTLIDIGRLEEEEEYSETDYNTFFEKADYLFKPYLKVKYPNSEISNLDSPIRCVFTHTGHRETLYKSFYEILDIFIRVLSKVI